MAKFGVIAVAKERVVKTWKDRETGKDMEHVGLVVYVGNISQKYDGFLPMDSRMASGSDGRQFPVYAGKVTIWDAKQKDLTLIPGEEIECEWTSNGTLRYAGSDD